MEALEFTNIPAYGSNEELKGVVHHADTENLRIAVYIRVHGGWWTKPYWDNPAVPIEADGTFTVKVATGGHDDRATDIAAFVIPAEYYPPGLRGESEIPADLLQKSLAHVQVSRTPTVPAEP